MRFHGMLVVRDEEDILPETLPQFLTWCDTVYVFDLGSTDRTWDIVQAAAAKDSRVVPFLRRPVVYSEDLRSVPFDAYRDRFADGDWVVKLDADEFYHVDPRTFVRERLRPHESLINLRWYFFRLTDRDVDAWESGRETVADRARPIAERRTVYTIPDYTEPRMFRYRKTMRWPQGLTFPNNLGIPARALIPIRHYPHRDPLQMERRYKLRYHMTLRARHGVLHWRSDDWRRDVLKLDGKIPSPACGPGTASAAGYWGNEAYAWWPGEPLPEVATNAHLRPWYLRPAIRAVYATMLPLLDRRRLAFQTPYQLAEIPDAENVTFYD